MTRSQTLRNADQRLLLFSLLYWGLKQRYAITKKGPDLRWLHSPARKGVVMTKHMAVIPKNYARRAVLSSRLLHHQWFDNSLPFVTGVLKNSQD